MASNDRELFVSHRRNGRQQCLGRCKWREAELSQGGIPCSAFPHHVSVLPHAHPGKSVGIVFSASGPRIIFCYDISWHLMIHWKCLIMHILMSYFHCGGLGKKHTRTEKVNTSSCSDIVVLTFTSDSIHFRISFYHCLSTSAKYELLLGSVV